MWMRIYVKFWCVPHDVYQSEYCAEIPEFPLGSSQSHVFPLLSCQRTTIFRQVHTEELPCGFLFPHREQTHVLFCAVAIGETNFSVSLITSYPFAAKVTLVAPPSLLWNSLSRYLGSMNDASTVAPEGREGRIVMSLCFCCYNSDLLF